MIFGENKRIFRLRNLILTDKKKNISDLAINNGQKEFSITNEFDFFLNKNYIYNNCQKY
jgi:hypothetical protein